ncbi:hypothetical protein WN72_21600 [Bradyrhizobium arachidis]|uniref:Uncharacterized protein n=1 Tax=Bradyrhizobium arachidis TaxID=858423 RepID=A0AAE7NQQ4_9BRAD|nr:hypothetical protein WN72_21600 [Bradyrhizobium arachidis]
MPNSFNENHSYGGGFECHRESTRLGSKAALSAIEIALEPCYGLSGLIRARAVSITFEPGKPNPQDG